VAAVGALAAAGLPVQAVNPRQVRDFGKATGKLAKTDAIDARVLAHFADAVRPAVRPLPDAQTQALSMLLARRHQVVEMQTAERNRRAGVSPSIRAEIDEHLAWLTARLKQADRELVRLLRGSPLWRERDDLLEGVPSVGPVLTATLVADLPEVGTLNHKQIAALVGTAPLNQDSGHMRSKRANWGGRSTVRAVPYTAAASATPSNPSDSSVLPAPCRERQTPRGGARRLYAQTLDNPQCYGPFQLALGRRRAILNYCLTADTVATGPTRASLNRRLSLARTSLLNVFLLVR
jgi:transposase